MTQVFHVAARAHTCPVPLIEREVAAWLWSRMTSAFPDTLAASLMPDHIHHVVRGADGNGVRRKLARVVNGLRRSKNPGAAVRWDPVSVVGPFTDRRKIARQIRYVVLNPARAGLVRDPLLWEWTTHRDVVGAVADPWVEAARLEGIIGVGHPDFIAEHHRYVSADPSTSVKGTPVPAPASDRGWAPRALGEILASALAATRSGPAEIRRPSAARRVFISLAAYCKVTDTEVIANLCGVTSRTLRWHRAQAEPPTRAALLCLGDRRLRAPYEEPTRKFLTTPHLVGS